jgi:gamma-glutamyltranspeptidase
MTPTRPTLYGARHAVSAGHYLATAAGGDRLAGLAAARAAFYRGDIAAKIVAHQKA